MVRAGARQDNNRPLLILGLEHENLDRLRKGQPIALKTEEIVPGWIGDVLIFADRDRHVIADKMARFIGPDTIVHEPVTPASDVFDG